MTVKKGLIFMGIDTNRTPPKVFKKRKCTCGVYLNKYNPNKKCYSCLIKGFGEYKINRGSR